MRHYFVPYNGDQPVSIVINGHRLVIISQNQESLQRHLDFLGGDRVESHVAEASFEDENHLLLSIAEEVGAGIVIAPEDTELVDVVRDLEGELPWIH